MNLKPESALEVAAQQYPSLKPRVDNELLMYEDLVEKVRNGTKTTTVRYARGYVRAPAAAELPFYASRPDDKNYKAPVGTVSIESVVLKEFGQLTDEDAQRDGLKDKEELTSVIQKIYGAVAPEEIVSIYYIKLL